ncbi:UPF0481 protein [Spatholobus suberectus]|nr:UPF0481 protein [Spatholobus suberectus]
MEFSGPLNFEDASETEPQQNNNSRQTLHVSANGSMEPTVKKEMEIVQKLSVKHEVLKNVLEAEKMMVEEKKVEMQKLANMLVNSLNNSRILLASDKNMAPLWLLHKTKGTEKVITGGLLFNIIITTT